MKSGDSLYSIWIGNRWYPVSNPSLYSKIPSIF
ncbi:hypothetical protein [Neobacillus niacini]